MRRTDDGPESRLRRALLRGGGTMLVCDQNFEGIDLRCRALVGVEFRRCEFAKAGFAGADLSLARFIDCNLYSADFSDSVLYTTWFYECNLTKADFRRAYLLGLRFRNVDITKASFDDIPAAGLERKSRDRATAGDLVCKVLGRLPAPATQLESRYSGLAVTGFRYVVSFLPDTRDAVPRAWIRAAETAKYLSSVHADNGYEARATHYYVVERRLRRRALRGSVRARIQGGADLLFGEVVWRYGSSVVRPVLALATLAFTSSLISYLAPLLSPAAGIQPADTFSPYTFHGWNTHSLIDFLNVGYFYLTATAGGSGDRLTGWVKIVFVGYVLLALWLIAITFEAFTKKVSSSR